MSSGSKVLGCFCGWQHPRGNRATCLHKLNSKGGEVMAISNNGQLTAIYNRKSTNSAPTPKHTKRVNWHYIHKECDKPIRNRWYVTATKPYKANNYDIVETSMANCRLQKKYGHSDFGYINEIEYIKKNLHKFSIMDLQMMANDKNISDIEKFIAIKMKEQKAIVNNCNVDDLVTAEQKQAEKLKHETRKKSIQLLDGLACSPRYSTIYA